MPTPEQLSGAIDAITRKQATLEEACRAIAGGTDERADLALADQLATSLSDRAPDPAFLARLELRLRQMPAAPPRRWERPRSPWLVLATATVLVIALAVAAFVVAPAPPASAQELLARARGAATGLGNGTVRSFSMTLLASGPNDLTAAPALPEPAAGNWQREDRNWYQAPDRWRSESRFLRRPDGSQDAAASVLVADGQTIWSYDPARQVLQVNPGRLSGPAKGGIGLSGTESSLSAVLAQSRCFPHPALTGSASVAGRDSYVVDLGVTACPSNGAGAYNGDVTVWIDKQTFFVLQSVTRETNSTRVALTQEVTQIRYNLPLPASLFTYTPPAGTRVLDNRATPTPTPTPPPTASPVMVQTAAGTAPFPAAAMLTNALPGGGTVQVGPFRFYAALYHDAALQLPTPATSTPLASDVAGVGVRILWRYQGTGMGGPIQELWGPEGTLQPVATYRALSAGQEGGRNGGGLLLPAGGHGPCGVRSWFGLHLATPAGTYGVNVQYWLRPANKACAGSLQLTDVTIVPVQP